MVGSKERKVSGGGIDRKKAPVESPEALRRRFEGVFDIDTVLSYDFWDFFDFCRYLCYFGYKADGYDGKLQSPDEFVEHHLGNCWDQTELQRAWFLNHGHQVSTYLVYYYLNDDCCPSHSVLTYEEEGKWFWFEPMFCGTEVEYSGVHEYGSKEELLRAARKVFAENGQKSGFLPKELDEQKWEICEYERPEYGITDEEFYKYCRGEG